MKKMCVIVILILLVGTGIYASREGEGIERRVVENFRFFVGKFPHEKLYAHTDREVYAAGDRIWFRVYGIHALTGEPGIPSRFVYVDLVDKRDSLVGRVKVGMRDTCFYGEMALPEGLQTDEYSLRAYTYNLRGMGEENVFQKKIRVVNPKDARVRMKVAYTKKSGGYVARIAFTDRTGVPYAHVPVRWSVGQLRNIYGTWLQYTDKEGVLEIKVDSAGELIRVRFEDDPLHDFERYIRVPEITEDFDVQFFPEGGELLVGNRQQVAFKAVGSDGLPVEVTGTLFQDSMALFDFASEHDGMGSFVLPVQRLRRFRAHVRTEDGLEKWVELPESSVDGWGVTVERRRGRVEYLVNKGEDAVPPGDLYVMLYARGQVFDIRAIKRRTRGLIDEKTLPEGIAMAVLMDGEGRVYSRRLFFVRHSEKPLLTCEADEREYGSREAVELEIGLANREAGTFSVSVTDNGKAPVDENAGNIRSELLMTSDLRGYVHEPGYYFREDVEEADRHLDLVMQTHGWSRFDPGAIARGEFPKERYEIEAGQEIRGRVKNFWGRGSARAEVSLISDRGHVRVTETDSAGKFVIDSIAFPDSTRFLAQVLNAKGRRGVEVEIERERLLPPRYGWPESVREGEKKEEEQEEWLEDYYDEYGRKVHVLREVLVKRKRQRRWSSFYDSFATYWRDSARIVEMAKGCEDFFQLLEMIPGVTTELVAGVDEIMRYGKPMRVLVNGYGGDTDVLRFMPLDMVWNISVIDSYTASTLFRTPAFGELLTTTSIEKNRQDVLLIEADPKFYPTIMAMRPERVNVSDFTLLGFQEPAEFYVPRYDVDSVRRDTTPDRRTTVYWQPVVRVEPGRRAKVRFYTADDPGTYTVTVEGVTRTGRVSRMRKELNVVN